MSVMKKNDKLENTKDNKLQNLKERDDDVLVLRNKPISMERRINVVSGPGGIPIIRDVIIIETEASLGRILTILGMLSIYGILFQTIMVVWEKYHKKSCRIFFSCLIFTVPIVISILTSNYLVLGFIVLLNAYISYILYAMRRGNKGLKFLFDNFQALFVLVYLTVIVSQIALFVTFFFFPNFVKMSLASFLFTLYLGILIREYVELSTIFFRALPNFGFKENSCSICNTSLVNPIQLSCSHSFHNSCIRGWLMVGKNYLCPVCNEKVIITSLKVMWWEKMELTFGVFLNFLRTFIAFCGVLIVALMFFSIK